MTRPLGMDPARAHNTNLWDVLIEREESAHLRSRWREEVSDDDWEGVVAVAASVLGRCPNPNGPPHRATGLALGKVQSGKTLSYTALIALAIDNRYRITVVLAGTKKPLLEQNYTRLYGDIAEGRPQVTAFKNPTQTDADVVRSVLHTGGHALIVVLKNRTRIDAVTNLLSALELRNYPALVIDDEGDEASLNTQFRLGVQSAVYASIQRLRNVLGSNAYIAYTATPQANLLISGIDGLSPDFAVLVNPGQGYCGGSVFFGDERDRYVRTVPDGEAEQDSHIIPDGLRLALATFLVGATILRQRSPNAMHSMLVHTSNLRRDQVNLQTSIRNLISLWRDILSLQDSDPARSDLLKIFHEAYSDLSSTVQNAPSWENVSSGLRQEIWLVEVWMVNSLPQARDPMGTPFRLRNNILVGGNMLGRGLTIQGLAVTYITRRAQTETNADTMEQRARWFGYKHDYLDLCRIFLTTQLRDDYTHLLMHEDDFWESLQRNQRQGLSVRDWPRMFMLDMEMGLKPTRSNIADYHQFRGKGWDVQSKLVEDEGLASQNVQAIRDFFREHPGDSRSYGNVRHSVIAHCPTEIVISELLAKIRIDPGEWDKYYVEEYLARLLLEGTLPSIEVMLMAEGRTRERTLRDRRIQPMQGRTPDKDTSDPSYYPGDENLHGGRVQLQVHIIRIQGENLPRPVETTALALYVPSDNPHFDLRFVVRGVDENN
jgi:hypothetical protein